TRGTPVQPLLAVSDPAIVVESVKLAEDRSGDLVVRLYEAHGNRSKATLTTSFQFTEVVATDLLERPVPSEAIAGAELTLRPFELLTLRFTGLER
ncbi:glycosyl hydrolase-related protein, partial [Jiangella anatolica]